MSTLRPLTGGRGPFVAGTAFDLGALGYQQAEYALSGTARAFAHATDGLAVVEEAPFTTRMVVYRPADAAAFNGTVWVEWLNVSGGLDAAPAWVFAHTELMRRGAAWVGVSAQQLGVLGGEGLVAGMSSPGLTGTDPVRYATLSHPGDRFSYDIFTQAGACARATTDTILEGLAVERVLAIGESQSAYRLVRYVNDIDPVEQQFEGYLVHACGVSATELHDVDDPASVREGPPTPFRDDLRVPLLCVESETDLMTLGYLAARQDDAEHLVIWEIAGTSHADVYTFVVGMTDTGRLPIEQLAAKWVAVRDFLGMHTDLPVNAGPQHYIMNAAVARLDEWVRDGTRPPAAARLEVVDGAFALDDVGNVKGGIRTPHVDVPTAVLSGFGNSGAPVAMLAGTTIPLDAATLASRYTDRADYLARFAAATDDAVARGFVLAADAAEITAIAEVNCPL